MRRSKTALGSRNASPEAKPVWTTSVSQDISHISPYQVLKDAIKAVPAVKYALGVAGVVAAVAVIKAFGIGYRVAFFGVIVMFVLMVLLVVFAKLTRTAPKHFMAPVVVLMWSFLLLAIGTACLLFTSVFFKLPLDLQDWIKPGSPLGTVQNPAAATLSTILVRGTPPLASQPAGPLELGFAVLAMRAGAKSFTPLDDGEEVTSKVDSYCVVARAFTRGYLYVFQQDTAGRIQWLFPSNDASEYSSGANPVLAGQIQTIPADKSDLLYLDSTTGVETIFAVFSATRWSELESALSAEAGNHDAKGPDMSRLGLVGNRGVGGMRKAPNLTPDPGATDAKVLTGVTYRLSPPVDLIQSSGSVLVIKRWFKHVASP